MSHLCTLYNSYTYIPKYLAIQCPTLSRRSRIITSTWTTMHIHNRYGLPVCKWRCQSLRSNFDHRTLDVTLIELALPSDRIHKRWIDWTNVYHGQWRDKNGEIRAHLSVLHILSWIRHLFFDRKFQFWEARGGVVRYSIYKKKSEWNGMYFRESCRSNASPVDWQLVRTHWARETGVRVSHRQVAQSMHNALFSCTLLISLDTFSSSYADRVYSFVRPGLLPLQRARWMSFYPDRMRWEYWPHMQNALVCSLGYEIQICIVYPGAISIHAIWSLGSHCGFHTGFNHGECLEFILVSLLLLLLSWLLLLLLLLFLLLLLARFVPIYLDKFECLFN